MRETSRSKDKKNPQAISMNALTAHCFCLSLGNILKQVLSKQNKLNQLMEVLLLKASSWAVAAEMWTTFTTLLICRGHDPQHYFKPQRPKMLSIYSNLQYTIFKHSPQSNLGKSDVCHQQLLFLFKQIMMIGAG